jgi:peptidoglycan/LPS O-acetylase OafA/YrhL
MLSRDRDPAEPIGVESRLGYRPALDGLRGLAVALVLSIHFFGWPPGGFLGVDLFFVLSGFLITVLLVEEWGLTGGVSLSRFYRRRFLRLFPALAALVVVHLLYLVVRPLIGEQTGFGSVGLDRFVGALAGPFYLQNIALAFDLPLRSELGHLWSLALEEQFYLLWPPVLLVMLKGRLSPRRMAWGLVIAIGMVCAWRLWLSIAEVSKDRIYYAPDTRFDSILVGCLGGLWFVHASIDARLAAAPRIARLAGISLAIIGATLIASEYLWAVYFGGGFTVLAVLSVLVILHAVLSDDDRLVGVLRARPLVWLGRLSYSLYLWHFFVILAMEQFVVSFIGDPSRFERVALGAVEIVLSVGLAVASYQLVERRFLRRKRRYEVSLHDPHTTVSVGAAGI